MNKCLNGDKLNFTLRWDQHDLPSFVIDQPFAETSLIFDQKHYFIG